MAIHIKYIKADLANIWEATRFVYRSDKRLFLIRMSLIAAQSILSVASLYVLKLLIDGIAKAVMHQATPRLSTVWLYAGLFCGIFLLIRLLSIVDQLSYEIVTQKLVDFIGNLLHKKSTELDLAYYDNSNYHDTFHRAQQEASYRPVQTLNNLSGILGNGLSLVGIIAMLSTLSWIGIATMIVAGLPSLWVKLVKSRIIFNWRNMNTSLFRMTDYVSALMTNRIYAKEIRVYNLAAHFQELFIAIRNKLVKQILAISVKRAKFDLFAVTFEIGALLAIIYLLTNKVFTGAITIGSFVMFFEAFRRGGVYVQSLVSDVSGIYENKLFLNNLFELLNLQPKIKSPEKKTAFPPKITHGIKFDTVSFAYPGAERMVIQNFNLFAKPGEITMIQGENGSGKTTLIKLLFRLYEYTEGVISIDGIDIKNFDLQELRSNISVIFQDFAQFDLTARENITLGNIAMRNDKSRLENAAKLSCAEQVIEQLPLHYDTILGKYFEDGEELSMGQWQRIALGKALFSDTPILVLDEPTSWLDSKAEAHFFQNLSCLKKDKIILLISHSANKEIGFDSIHSLP